MKKTLIIALFISLFNFYANGQELKGLYFENLAGTKWISNLDVLDPTIFTSKEFGISLIKENINTDSLSGLIWKFADKKILITSNSDSIVTLTYEIDRSNRKIRFKNFTDSINLEYISVSTGSFVYFYSDRIIEISGEARNSKDGALIIGEQSTYRVKNKREWKDKYYCKRIKVKAYVINDEFVTKEDLGYDVGIISQGRLGRTTTIKLRGRIDINE